LRYYLLHLLAHEHLHVLRTEHNSRRRRPFPWRYDGDRIADCRQTPPDRLACWRRARVADRARGTYMDNITTRLVARLLPDARLHVYPDGHLGLLTMADDPRRVGQRLPRITVPSRRAVLR